MPKSKASSAGDDRKRDDDKDSKKLSRDDKSRDGDKDRKKSSRDERNGDDDKSKRRSSRGEKDREDDKESKRSSRRSESGDRKSTRRERSLSDDRSKASKSSDKKERRPKRRNTDGEIVEDPYSYSTSRAGETDAFNTQTASASFSQFPGQMDGFSSGFNPVGPSSSGPRLSDHVPDQFPGQFPEGAALPYRPPQSIAEGGPGLAADYYGDAGQSIHSQPGARLHSPTIIPANQDAHLITPSVQPNPPPEPSASGNVGAAASFYGTNPTQSFSVSPMTRPQNGGSSSGIGTAALGATAGAAAGYMMGGHGGRRDSSSSSDSQRPPRPSTQNPYAPGSTAPPMHSSNLPYAAAAGAAALGAAAYHHHNHSQHADSYDSGYGGGVGMAQHRRRHGPLSKFVDFFRDPDAVAQYEVYSEYIGICRYCFEPGSSPRDAPRKHHFKRRRSFERNGSNLRVDKANRYSTSDEEKHRSRKGEVLGAAATGIGLAAVGKQLFGNNRDFDDTYSVQTGHRNASSSSVNLARRDSDGRVKRGVVQHSNGKSPSYIEVAGESSRKREKRDSRAGEAAMAAAAGAVIGAAARSSKKRHSSSERDRKHKSRNDSSSPSRRKSQKSPRESSGFFGGFFSPPSSGKDKNKKKKSGGLFNFGNSSSSSVSDSGRRRRKSSSGRIRNESEAKDTLLELGAATAALAAVDSASRNGRGKRSGGIVAVKESKRKDKGSRRRHSHSDDDGWESASDDNVSVDSALAFGSDSSGTRRRHRKREDSRRQHNGAARVGAGVVGGMALSSLLKGDEHERDGKRRSAVRPDPVPIQQPQPIAPVRTSVYHTDSSFTEPSGRTVTGIASIPYESPDNRPEERRIRRGDADYVTVSPKIRKSRDEASSVRFDFTEEQQERHRRADERESEVSGRTEREERKERKERRRKSREEDRKREESANHDTRNAALAGIAGVAVGAAVASEVSSKEKRRKKRRESKDEERDEHRQSRTEHEIRDDINEDHSMPGAFPEAAADVTAAKITHFDRDQSKYDDLSDVEREKLIHDRERIIARRAAALVQAAPHNEYEEYASFFAPDILAKDAKGKERSGDPDPDGVFDMSQAQIIEVVPSFARDEPSSPVLAGLELFNDPPVDVTTLVLPWMVPPLRLINPTPVPSFAGSIRDEHSPDRGVQERDGEEEEERSKSSKKTKIRFEDDEAEEARDLPRDDNEEEPTRRSKKKKKKSRREVQDEDEEPTANGSYGYDVDFAATVAAGLSKTGFDSDIVIDDPKYRRRDSPPGSNGSPTGERHGIYEPQHGWVDDDELPPSPPEKPRDLQDDASSISSKRSKKSKRKDSKKSRKSEEGDGADREVPTGDIYESAKEEAESALSKFSKAKEVESTVSKSSKTEDAPEANGVPKQEKKASKWDMFRRGMGGAAAGATAAEVIDGSKKISTDGQQNGDKTEEESFLGERRRPTKPPDSESGEVFRGRDSGSIHSRSRSSPPGSRQLSPVKVTDIARDDSSLPGNGAHSPVTSPGHWRRTSLQNFGTFSPTAVPIQFRRPVPAGRSSSVTPLGSPQTPRTRKPRPISTEFKSNEVRPLFLVEQHRPKSGFPADDHEVLPALPASVASSDMGDGPDDDEEEERTSKFKGAPIDIAEAQKSAEDLLDSQEATPTAATFQDEETEKRKKREQSALEESMRESMARELEWNVRQSPEFQKREQKRVSGEGIGAWSALGAGALASGALATAVKANEDSQQDAERDLSSEPATAKRSDSLKKAKGSKSRKKDTVGSEPDAPESTIPVSRTISKDMGNDRVAAAMAAIAAADAELGTPTRESARDVDMPMDDVKPAEPEPADDLDFSFTSKKKKKKGKKAQQGWDESTPEPKAEFRSEDVVGDDTQRLDSSVQAEIAQDPDIDNEWFSSKKDKKKAKKGKGLAAAAAATATVVAGGIAIDEHLSRSDKEHETAFAEDDASSSRDVSARNLQDVTMSDDMAADRDTFTAPLSKKDKKKQKKAKGKATRDDETETPEHANTPMDSTREATPTPSVDESFHDAASMQLVDESADEFHDLDDEPFVKHADSNDLKDAFEEEPSGTRTPTGLEPEAPIDAEDEEFAFTTKKSKKDKKKAKKDKAQLQDSEQADTDAQRGTSFDEIVSTSEKAIPPEDLSTATHASTARDEPEAEIAPEPEFGFTSGKKKKKKGKRVDTFSFDDEPQPKDEPTTESFATKDATDMADQAKDAPPEVSRESEPQPENDADADFAFSGIKKGKRKQKSKRVDAFSFEDEAELKDMPASVDTGAPDTSVVATVEAEPQPETDAGTKFPITVTKKSKKMKPSRMNALFFEDDAELRDMPASVDTSAQDISDVATENADKPKDAAPEFSVEAEPQPEIDPDAEFAFTPSKKNKKKSKRANTVTFDEETEVKTISPSNDTKPLPEAIGGEDSFHEHESELKETSQDVDTLSQAEPVPDVDPEAEPEFTMSAGKKKKKKGKRAETFLFDDENPQTAAPDVVTSGGDASLVPTPRAKSLEGEGDRAAQADDFDFSMPMTKKERKKAEKAAKEAQAAKDAQAAADPMELDRSVDEALETSTGGDDETFLQQNEPERESALKAEPEPEFSMPLSKKDRKKAAKKARAADYDDAELAEDPIAEESVSKSIDESSMTEEPEAVPQSEQLDQVPQADEADLEFSMLSKKERKKLAKKGRTSMFDIAANELPTEPEASREAVADAPRDALEESTAPIESENMPFTEEAEPEFSMPLSKKERKKLSKKGRTGTFDLEEEAPEALTELSADAKLSEEADTAAPVEEAKTAAESAEPELEFSMPLSKKDKKKLAKKGRGTTFDLAEETPDAALEPSAEQEPSEVSEKAILVDEPEVEFSMPLSKKDKKKLAKKGRSATFDLEEPSTEQAVDPSAEHIVSEAVDKDLPVEEPTQATQLDEPEPEFSMPLSKKDKKKLSKKQRAATFDLDEPVPTDETAMPVENQPLDSDEKKPSLPEAELLQQLEEPVEEFSMPLSKKDKKKLAKKGRAATFDLDEPSENVAEAAADAAPSDTIEKEVLAQEPQETPQGEDADLEFSMPLSKKDKKKQAKKARAATFDLDEPAQQEADEPASDRAVDVTPIETVDKADDVVEAEPEFSMPLSKKERKKLSKKGRAATFDFDDSNAMVASEESADRAIDDVPPESVDTSADVAKPEAEPEPEQEPEFSMPLSKKDKKKLAKKGRAATFDLSEAVAEDTIELRDNDAAVTEDPMEADVVQRDTTETTAPAEEVTAPEPSTEDFFTPTKKGKKGKKGKRSSTLDFSEEPTPAPEDSSRAMAESEEPKLVDPDIVMQEEPDAVPESSHAATDNVEREQPAAEADADTIDLAAFSTKKSKKDKKKRKSAAWEEDSNNLAAEPPVEDIIETEANDTARDVSNTIDEDPQPDEIGALLRQFSKEKKKKSTAFENDDDANSEKAQPDLAEAEADTPPVLGDNQGIIDDPQLEETAPLSRSLSKKDKKKKKSQAWEEEDAAVSEQIPEEIAGPEPEISAIAEKDKGIIDEPQSEDFAPLLRKLSKKDKKKRKSQGRQDEDDMSQEQPSKDVLAPVLEAATIAGGVKDAEADPQSEDFAPLSRKLSKKDKKKRKSQAWQDEDEVTSEQAPEGVPVPEPEVLMQEQEDRGIIDDPQSEDVTPLSRKLSKKDKKKKKSKAWEEEEEAASEQVSETVPEPEADVPIQAEEGKGFAIESQSEDVTPLSRKLSKKDKKKKKLLDWDDAAVTEEATTTPREDVAGRELVEDKDEQKVDETSLTRKLSKKEKKRRQQLDWGADDAESSELREAPEVIASDDVNDATLPSPLVQQGGGDPFDDRFAEEPERQERDFMIPGAFGDELLSDNEPIRAIEIPREDAVAQDEDWSGVTSSKKGKKGKKSKRGMFEIQDDEERERELAPEVHLHAAEGDSTTFEHHAGERSPSAEERSSPRRSKHFSADGLAPMAAAFASATRSHRYSSSKPPSPEIDMDEEAWVEAERRALAGLPPKMPSDQVEDNAEHGHARSRSPSSDRRSDDGSPKRVSRQKSKSKKKRRQSRDTYDSDDNDSQRVSERSRDRSGERERKTSSLGTAAALAAAGVATGAAVEGLSRSDSKSEKKSKKKKQRESIRWEDDQEDSRPHDDSEHQTDKKTEPSAKYRDSGLQMASPELPEHPASSRNIRDSGYQGSPGMLGFSDVEDEHKVPGQFSGNGELRVDIEHDPNYDVNVTQGAHELSDESADEARQRRRRGKETRDTGYPSPEPEDLTTRDRASAALFSSSPSTREAIPGQEFGSIEDAHLRNTGGLYSPARTPLPYESAPLATIEEQSPDVDRTQKHERDGSDDEHSELSVKARKTSRYPKRAHSPLPTSSPRNLGMISTDDLISRQSWPSVDEEEGTVEFDRRKRREGSAESHGLDTSRRRKLPSPEAARRSISGDSVRSNESVGSINAIIRSPPDHTQQALRRSAMHRSVSGDLRAASRQSQHSSDTSPKQERDAKTSHPGGDTRDLDPQKEREVVASSSSYDPVNDKGKERISKMTDVYEAWGDAQGSPRSPNRPPSMRRRQSMQILDLETRLDQLVSENRLLQDAKARAERTLDEAHDDHGGKSEALEEALRTRDQYLREKDHELEHLKSTLEGLQHHVSELTAANAGLTAAHAARSVAGGDDYEQRYRELQAEHHAAQEEWEANSRELDQLRSKHVDLSGGMEDIVRAEVAAALTTKEAELQAVRDELEATKEQVRQLRDQILHGSGDDDDQIPVRDEDYIEAQCQKLCTLVQTWVMRFSKFSDTKICKSVKDLSDDVIRDRFEDVMLDGSDVDALLRDRVRRRDVFMSVVMGMVQQYIFMRYLFGLDREQRSKLKTLEKHLTEVASESSVAKWRSTTLNLLTRRQQFSQQRATDVAELVDDIYTTLAKVLNPPSDKRQQGRDTLSKVLSSAVDLSIDMRLQRAQYVMLPPLQPEYDAHGDIARTVPFNASMMNERSGAHASNEALESQGAAVQLVLFPLVEKQGDDTGHGTDEIVVCPAQVLVAADPRSKKKNVRVMSASEGMEGGMF